VKRQAFGNANTELVLLTPLIPKWLLASLKKSFNDCRPLKALDIPFGVKLSLTLEVYWEQATSEQFTEAIAAYKRNASQITASYPHKGLPRTKTSTWVWAHVIQRMRLESDLAGCTIEEATATLLSIAMSMAQDTADVLRWMEERSDQIALLPRQTRTRKREESRRWEGFDPSKLEGMDRIVVEMRQQGHSFFRIGEKLGLSRQRVQQLEREIAARFDIPIQKQKEKIRKKSKSKRKTPPKVKTTP
jgi:DNA-binding CsgD family transcriptional regulator